MMTNIDGLSGEEETLALQLVNTQEYSEEPTTGIVEAEDYMVCKLCGGNTQLVMENTGWSAPDPVLYELVGVKCETCGYLEKF